MSLGTQRSVPAQQSQVQQRRGHRRQRTISRSESVLEEVERFTKRTISVCLTQQEEDSELPSVTEVSTYEAIGSGDEEEDVENVSVTENGHRDGEHTIS